MKRIAIYSRKSKETDTGESINNQINICKNYFANQYSECKFEVFTDEGFSGGNTNRPSFKRMMQLAKYQEFDVIAVYKIDRMARNITDFFKIYSELERNDITLVSVTEGFDATTPIGRMMMTMLAGFADMERENIRQRVKDNMNELAKLGRWSGGTPPTGYTSSTKTIDGKKSTYLKLIKEDAPKVELIFKLVSEGYTTFQVGQTLNLNPKTILNIVQNPTYIKSDYTSKAYLEKIGYKVYGDINGKGFLSYGRRPRKNGKKLYNAKGMFVAVSEHDGLIDSETWIAANEQLISRGLEARPRISNNSFLAHLVKCTCGSGMFISSGRLRKDGTKVYYFKCSAKYHDSSSCSITKSLRVDLAEEYFLNELHNLSISKTLLNDYINIETKTHNYAEQVADLKKTLKSNSKTINDLTEKLLILNGDALKIINDKINNLSEENYILNNEIFILERKILLDKKLVSVETLQKKIRKLLSTFDELPLEQKRISVQHLIKEIVYDGNDSIKIIFSDVI